MKTLIIKAVKTDKGYELIGSNGDKPQEGLAHKTRSAAYADAKLLWPANSVWQGQKIKSGYRIVID